MMFLSWIISTLMKPFCELQERFLGTITSFLLRLLLFCILALMKIFNLCMEYGWTIMTRMNGTKNILQFFNDNVSN